MRHKFINQTFWERVRLIVGTVVVITSSSAFGQQGTNVSSGTSNQLNALDSLLTRSTLTDGWFGLQPSLQEHGITLRAELTQFWSAMTSGDGSGSCEYGGKGDFYLTMTDPKLDCGMAFSLGFTTNKTMATIRTGLVEPCSPIIPASLFPVPARATSASRLPRSFPMWWRSSLAS